MAWNPPNPEKPKDQDPWTGRAKKNPEQGPPLLEDLFKQLFKKLSNGDKNLGKTPSFNISKKILWIFIVFLIIVLWFVGGIHVLNKQQEGLVFRFGAYEKTIDAGWHWTPFGIDHVMIFDRSATIDETLSSDVISQDSSLARMSIKLTYHVTEPKKYFLNFADSPKMIRELAASVLQQTAAKNDLSAAFADNKDASFSNQLQQSLTQALTQQAIGVQLDNISIVSIAVPDAVKEVFNKMDALYEEQNKQQQQAADYEKSILPPAQAKADQLIASAKSYAAQATVKAQEEVAAFLSELPVYQKAPALTRYRLYSEAMENILSKTTKVVVDEKAGGTTVYLPPADRAANSTTSSTTNTVTASTAVPADAAKADDSDNTPSTSMYADVQGGY